MNILISNDDGILASGIQILIRACAHFGTVYVAAPKTQQSAKSHAMTYKGELMVEEIKPMLGAFRAVAVHGTPVDSVRAGLKVFDVEFDLVITGINEGVNMAMDVIYSGTVGAAFEAAVHKVPAIAMSAPTTTLPYLYDETVKLLDEIIESKLYEKTAVLNVNFPHAKYTKVNGVRITKQGLRIQHTEMIKSDKENMYHLSGTKTLFREDPQSDKTAYDEGYVSITPLTLDRTDYQKFNAVLDELD